MQKKGLNEVITVILLILIVMAAIFIIWFFINPQLKKSASAVETQSFSGALNVDPKSIVISDEDEIEGDDTIQFVIRRDSSSADVIGAIVILIDSNGNMHSDKILREIKPLESIFFSKKFTEAGLADVKKIEVYAVLKDSEGKETISSIKTETSVGNSRRRNDISPPNPPSGNVPPELDSANPPILSQLTQGGGGSLIVTIKNNNANSIIISRISVSADKGVTCSTINPNSAIVGLRTGQFTLSCSGVLLDNSPVQVNIATYYVYEGTEYNKDFSQSISVQNRLYSPIIAGSVTAAQISDTNGQGVLRLSLRNSYDNSMVINSLSFSSAGVNCPLITYNPGITIPPSSNSQIFELECTGLLAGNTISGNIVVGYTYNTQLKSVQLGIGTVNIVDERYIPQMQIEAAQINEPNGEGILKIALTNPHQQNIVVNSFSNFQILDDASSQVNCQEESYLPTGITIQQGQTANFDIRCTHLYKDRIIQGSLTINYKYGQVSKSAVKTFENVNVDDNMFKPELLQITAAQTNQATKEGIIKIYLKNPYPNSIKINTIDYVDNNYDPISCTPIGPDYSLGAYSQEYFELSCTNMNSGESLQGAVNVYYDCFDGYGERQAIYDASNTLIEDLTYYPTLYSIEAYQITSNGEGMVKISLSNYYDFNIPISYLNYIDSYGISCNLESYGSGVSIGPHSSLELDLHCYNMYYSSSSLYGYVEVGYKIGGSDRVSNNQFVSSSISNSQIEADWGTDSTVNYFPPGDFSIKIYNNHPYDIVINLGDGSVNINPTNGASSCVVTQFFYYDGSNPQVQSYPAQSSGTGIRLHPASSAFMQGYCTGIDYPGNTFGSSITLNLEIDEFTTDEYGNGIEYYYGHEFYYQTTILQGQDMPQYNGFGEAYVVYDWDDYGYQMECKTYGAAHFQVVNPSSATVDFSVDDLSISPTSGASGCSINSVYVYGLGSFYSGQIFSLAPNGIFEVYYDCSGMNEGSNFEAYVNLQFTVNGITYSNPFNFNTQTQCY